MLACILNLWIVRWSVAGCVFHDRNGHLVLGMEVPVAAYVKEGGELFLPLLQAVRVFVDVGTLGAVVDRE